MVESERHLTAFLHVIEQVAIFVRFRSSADQRLPDEHLFDLMDAIHNIPEMLTRPGHYFTPQMIREIFSDYDRKWGNEGIGLNKLLDDGFTKFDAGGGCSNRDVAIKLR